MADVLSDHIVCKITQRNNIRRTNTCDPALKLEEITPDIQKHKQTYRKKPWMHTGITGTTRSFFRRPYTVYPTEYPTPTKHLHNIQQQNSNHTQTYCELFHQTIHKHCQTRNTQGKQIH